MNANELADKLKQGHWEGGTREQAATMLRQQQAEIEALKKEAALQRLFDFTQEADNEPVAWINLNIFKDEALYLADCVSETKVDNMGITTPLYTHPVKELTDEEIHDLIINKTTDADMIKQALRKAQEK